MKFRTAINIDEIQTSKKQIDYDDKIFLIGSCFVEQIGKKLDYYRFQNLINPFGILFNPVSIKKALSNVINLREYRSNDLILHEERWHSFHHHSIFSHQNKETALEQINKSITTAHTFLQSSRLAIITLGTAWVYRHLASNELVANNHKVPNIAFQKELMSYDEIKKSLIASVDLLQQFNPKIDILFTVSPVLHLKDGMVDASHSKAILIAAIQEVLANENVYYFPSYEIQMHDLRDYRFYAKDMLHPNESAVDYIWEIFRKSWIDIEVEPIMKKVEKVQKGLAHKVFNDKSDSHKMFMKKIDALKNDLLENNGINF